MSKLASATTIPVMNKAMQENSRTSLRIERTAIPESIAVGPFLDCGARKTYAKLPLAVVAAVVGRSTLR